MHIHDIQNQMHPYLENLIWNGCYYQQEIKMAQFWKIHDTELRPPRQLYVEKKPGNKNKHTTRNR